MAVDKQNFIKDVERLRNARVIVLDKEIIDATGVAKGNLSSYLSGKAKPSRNFLDRFYSHYGERLKNLSSESGKKDSLETNAKRVEGMILGPPETYEEYIELLKYTVGIQKEVIKNKDREIADLERKLKNESS